MNINENQAQATSQNKAIANWLKQGKSITALEALNYFGYFRLASRISDLRKTDLNIEVSRIVLPNGKRVAQYRLRKEATV